MDSSNPEPDPRADLASDDASNEAGERDANGSAAVTNGAPRARRSRSRRPPATIAAETTTDEVEPPKKKRTRRKKPADETAAEAPTATDAAISAETAEETTEARRPSDRRRRSRRPPPAAASEAAASEPEAAASEAAASDPEAAASEPAIVAAEVVMLVETVEEIASDPARDVTPDDVVATERAELFAYGDPDAVTEADLAIVRELRAADRATRQRERDRDRRERPRERDRDARSAPNRVPELPPLPTTGPKPTIHRRAFPSEHLDEDALKVLRRLHRNGYRAYLVGGCVRDLLLGRKAKDFDVATSARPHDVKQLFRNCRIIGRRFRLAHILFGGGKVIETATFRRDPTAAADEDTFVAEAEEAREAIDSGELDVATVLRPAMKARDDDADLLIRNDNVFGEPHEDALRRDFTINGLFYDVERGEVIDYVGGLRDLERRAINTIGLPDVRFREDPVRILRAIKFSARLDLGIDPDCYDAMVAQREELLKAAKPRLLEEILRLLRGGAAHRSVWLAWEMGVLSVVLPELASFLDDDAPRSKLLWGRLDAIDAAVRNKRVPSDSVLLGALLLGPIEEAIEGAKDPSVAYEDFMHEVTESLAVPRRMKERMRAIIGSQRRLRAGRHAPLTRRDFFEEAVQLFELEHAARGQKAPDLHAEAMHPEGDGETAIRRRRRRRSRR
ncbi:hypothetical protein [Sandaracinus amylolyticus]|uniref:Poly(A) polymerase I n=1 Tax=Sandaracinus amylolyticus TaxID=927083 RepID=A0A0F6W7C9_9BACT|nr:hypothetical protein [Sandaracinus amylolyticus]AKF09368.1 Poly(A) polymerase [Sandaracinus amylolyticus]